MGRMMGEERHSRSEIDGYLRDNCTVARRSTATSEKGSGRRLTLQENGFLALSVLRTFAKVNSCAR
jgi:hypothetical protein